MKRLTAVLLLLILILPSFAASADGGISTYPERAIAYMDITFKCGCSRIGTGAMIATDGLITAGPNLICKDHSQKADKIVFYFGYVSDDNYYYRYNGHFHYWYLDSFSKGYQSRNDIGYVLFDEYVGDTTGWLATRYGTDREFDGQTCSILAYSSDGELTDYSAQISIDSKLQFAMNQEALPYGAEGAPVIIYRDGHATLVAVYNSHTSRACLGRRLTKDMFDQMRKRLTFRK